MRQSRSVLVTDAVVGVGVAAAAEVELWLTDASEIEGHASGLHLLAAALLPAFALRRTSPLASVAVAAAAFAVQPLLGTAPVAVPFLALLFLLGSLGWYAETAAGVVGVVLTLLSALTGTLVDGHPTGDLVVNVVVVTAAWGGTRLVRRATDRRVAAELAADRAAHEAAAVERERISRDLHDSLGHALTLVTLQAGAAREGCSRPGDRATFEDIEHTGREALADLHRYLDLLGPGQGEAPGLADLPELVNGIRRQGLEVDLRLEADGVPASVGTALYRVVQEGLTNVVRHSRANRVAVEVVRNPLDVVATVRDDGRPGPSSPVGTGGRGLRGLGERVALFDGSLGAGPTPDGWLVEAHIPLEQP